MDESVAVFVKNDVQAYAESCRMLGRADLRGVLPTIKVPTRIAVGAEDYATPPARLPRLRKIFETVEHWTQTKTKFEAMEILNKYDIPCGPILSMKEIAEDQSLRTTGTVVEVDHPKRGKYLTVGNPIKLSDSPAEVRRAPLLGEHTEEVLKTLVGLKDDEIQAARQQGAI